MYRTLDGLHGSKELAVNKAYLIRCSCYSIVVNKIVFYRINSVIYEFTLLCTSLDKSVIRALPVSLGWPRDTCKYPDVRKYP